MRSTRVDVVVLRLAHDSLVVPQLRLILGKADVARRAKKRIFRVAMLASLSEDIVSNHQKARLCVISEWEFGRYLARSRE